MIQCAYQAGEVYNIYISVIAKQLQARGNLVRAWIRA